MQTNSTARKNTAQEEDFHPAFLFRGTSKPHQPIATGTSRNIDVQEPVHHVRPVTPSKNDDSEKIHSGIVKWFNIEKGYGFVILDDDRQVFLHSDRLPPRIIGALRPGLSVQMFITTVPKGLACKQIVQLASKATQANLDRIGEPTPKNEKRPNITDASVKFYNDAKGFGFLTPDRDLGRDIYVSARLLHQFRIETPLLTGARVRVEYFIHARGIEALSIESLQNSDEAETPENERVRGPGDVDDRW